MEERHSAHPFSSGYQPRSTLIKVRVDRSTAREQLMKHLGLFKEDNSQKPSVEVHAPGVRKVVFEPIPKTRKG
jgi:hypothetical protein